MKTLALTAADCAELNRVIPPQRGSPLGGGIHVTIPDDWKERILRGEKVPGCRYFAPSAEGIMPLDAAVEAELVAVGYAKVTAVLAKVAAVAVDEEVIK